MTTTVSKMAFYSQLIQIDRTTREFFYGCVDLKFGILFLFFETEIYFFCKFEFYGGGKMVMVNVTMIEGVEIRTE